MVNPKQPSAEALSFEELMQQLEVLVERMEAGELSLEESLQAYEQGVHLTRQCQQQLNQAEQRVLALQENGGEPSFAPVNLSPAEKFENSTNLSGSAASQEA